MADVKQLKINNTPYNIKDDVARSAISGEGGVLEIIEQLDEEKQDAIPIIDLT